MEIDRLKLEYLEKTKLFEELKDVVLYKLQSEIKSNLHTPTISLREKDDVGIEFKAGLKQDYYGFFVSSPKNSQTKLLAKQRVTEIIQFSSLLESMNIQKISAQSH
ncbi:MAG: hypothetical protein FFODKBPE_00220 [Candidatus Argoarchaeum ethanivorans]|uniref:Uncharacterized protein n=1 Tax=Candidatus Argoarchaeum ethanivorans TaxID=2608793 RepID=A0A811T652_9EURY|nr:MAG: hypothetical protein FFODKBPE_00220 [Candidatus Argoarchaeum ethanivorans]